LLEKSINVIEKGFHVGLLIVNKYFFLFCYVLFNKCLVVCDENNPSFGIRLCCKDTNYVIGFSCYSKLYNILWLSMLHIMGYWMKIGLLCLLFTFLISLYWEKQQWIENAWKAFDNLQDMLLCYPRRTIISICQVSLFSLLANWFNVVGPLHKKVIDSFIIRIVTITKCMWQN